MMRIPGHPLRIQRKISTRMTRLMRGLGFKVHPEDAHIAEERLKTCLREFVQQNNENYQILRMFNLLFENGSTVTLSQKMALKEALRKGWHLTRPTTPRGEYEEYIMPESYKLELMFEPHDDPIYDQAHDQIPMDRLVKMQRLFQSFLERQRRKVERIVFTYVRAHMNFEIDAVPSQEFNALQNRVLEQVDFAPVDQFTRSNENGVNHEVSVESQSAKGNESSRNEKTSEPMNLITRAKVIFAEADKQGKVTHHYPYGNPNEQPKENEVQGKSNASTLKPAEPVPFDINEVHARMKERAKKQKIAKPESDQSDQSSGSVKEEESGQTSAKAELDEGLSPTQSQSHDTSVEAEQNSDQPILEQSSPNKSSENKKSSESSHKTLSEPKESSESSVAAVSETKKSPEMETPQETVEQTSQPSEKKSSQNMDDQADVKSETQLDQESTQTEPIADQLDDTIQADKSHQSKEGKTEPIDNENTVNEDAIKENVDKVGKTSEDSVETPEVSPENKEVSDSIVQDDKSKAEELEGHDSQNVSSEDEMEQREKSEEQEVDGSNVVNEDELKSEHTGKDQSVQTPEVDSQNQSNTDESESQKTQDQEIKDIAQMSDKSDKEKVIEDQDTSTPSEEDKTKEFKENGTSLDNEDQIPVETSEDQASIPETDKSPEKTSEDQFNASETQESPNSPTDDQTNTSETSETPEKTSQDAQIPEDDQQKSTKTVPIEGDESQASGDTQDQDNSNLDKSEKTQSGSPLTEQDQDTQSGDLGSEKSPEKNAKQSEGASPKLDNQDQSGIQDDTTGVNDQALKSPSLEQKTTSDDQSAATIEGDASPTLTPKDASAKDDIIPPINEENTSEKTAIQSEPKGSDQIDENDQSLDAQGLPKEKGSQDQGAIPEAKSDSNKQEVSEKSIAQDLKKMNDGLEDVNNVNAEQLIEGDQTPKVDSDEDIMKPNEADLEQKMKEEKEKADRLRIQKLEEEEKERKRLEIQKKQEDERKRLEQLKIEEEKLKAAKEKERLRLEEDKKKQMLKELKEKEEAEKQKKLEQERIQREKDEAEKKAKLEAEKKAKLEAEKKAKLEAEKKAKLEAEKQAKLEAEKKAKLEAEKKAKLEAEKKAKADAEKKAAEEKSKEKKTLTMNKFKKEKTSEEKEVNKAVDKIIAESGTELTAQIDGYRPLKITYDIRYLYLFLKGTKVSPPEIDRYMKEFKETLAKVDEMVKTFLKIKDQKNQVWPISDIQTEACYGGPLKGFINKLDASGPTKIMNNKIETDVLIIVRIRKTPDQILASAGPCIVKNSRTIVGMMEINKENMEFASTRAPFEKYSDAMTLLHELFHALAFNEGIYKNLATDLKNLSNPNNRLNDKKRFEYLQRLAFIPGGNPLLDNEHWNESYIPNDLMIPIERVDTVLSIFTLEYIEYVSKFDEIKTFRQNLQYNYMATEIKDHKEFFSYDCSKETGKSKYKNFCTNKEKITTKSGCDSTFIFKAGCNGNKLKNNCFERKAEKTGSCITELKPGTPVAVKAFETRGLTSRCIEAADSKDAYCMRIALEKNDIKIMMPNDNFVTCSIGQSQKPISFSYEINGKPTKFEIMCPDVKRFVDVYNRFACPDMCFGNGFCSDGKCQCFEGYDSTTNCKTKKSYSTAQTNFIS